MVKRLKRLLEQKPLFYIYEVVRVKYEKVGLWITILIVILFIALFIFGFVILPKYYPMPID